MAGSVQVIDLAAVGGTGCAPVVVNATAARITASVDGGDPVGPRPNINFIGVSGIVALVADDAVNDEIDVTIVGGGGSSGGELVIRVDGGPDLGPQPRLNLIPGLGMQIDAVEDLGDNEIDITFTASGVGGGGATPAVSAPPKVANASALGSISARFAREDHTHQGVNIDENQTITGTKTVVSGIIFSEIADPAAPPSDSIRLYGADNGGTTVLRGRGPSLAAADVVQIGGQLGGIGPTPDVRGIRETGGPTLLTIGAIASGDLLLRSGSNVIGVSSGIFQAADADLNSVANLGTTGLVTRTALNTWTTRTLQPPAAGISITNPAGIAGDPTFALTNDLAAVEALTVSGVIVRTDTDTWTARTLVPPVSGFSIASPAGIGGNPTFALTDDLAAVEALTTAGLAARTALNTWTTRTIEAGAGIQVTNGDGISGNPTIASTVVAPTAATDAPPKVGNASVLGAQTRYAREDHTHQGVNLDEAQTMAGLKTIASGIIFMEIADPANPPADQIRLYGFDQSGTTVLRARTAAGVSADVAQIAGQLGGTGASPDVRGIRETSGPTLLTIAGIGSGELLLRSGTNVIGVSSGIFQAADPDLNSIANLDTTGIVTRTATNTYATRTLQQPAAGITITNPAGLAGDPTLVLANDLGAVEALTVSGLIARSNTDTWTARTLIPPPSGFSIASPAGVGGNPTFALTDDLAAVEGLSTAGLTTRTAANTWVTRTLQPPAAGITITNPGGVAGDPTFVLANDLGSIEAMTVSGLVVRNGDETWTTVRLIAGSNIAIENPAGLGGNITISSTGGGGTPASVAPPKVGDASVLGVSSAFAREDHTHQGVNLDEDQTITGTKTVVSGIIFMEIADPANPPADTIRLYGFDQSGTSVLRARTGAGVSADIAQIAGQLGGTGASPDVRGLRETGGPTLLTYGAIASGDLLLRSGSNIIGVSSGIFQASDPDLNSLANLSGTGLIARTADNTYALRTLQQPAAGLTITNPAGVGGDPTFAFANDLAAIEALTVSGIIVRTGTDTWTSRTLVPPLSGFSIASPAGVGGNPTFALTDDLAAVEGLTTAGLATRTADNTWVTRTLQPPAAGITITNPAGLAGDPTLVLANDLAALEALTPSGFAFRTGTDAWSLVQLSAIDHNGLMNLSSGDAHKEYVRLLGRQGGQIIFGGTDFGNNLTLKPNPSYDYNAADSVGGIGVINIHGRIRNRETFTPTQQLGSMINFINDWGTTSLETVFPTAYRTQSSGKYNYTTSGGQAGPGGLLAFDCNNHVTKITSGTDSGTLTKWQAAEMRHRWLYNAQGAGGTRIFGNYQAAGSVANVNGTASGLATIDRYYGFGMSSFSPSPIDYVGNGVTVEEYDAFWCPRINYTGIIGELYGLAVEDQDTVSNDIITRRAAVRSRLTYGGSRFGLYFDGDASNVMAGPLRIGDSTSPKPTYSLDTARGLFIHNQSNFSASGIHNLMTLLGEAGGSGNTFNNASNSSFRGCFMGGIVSYAAGNPNAGGSGNLFSIGATLTPGANGRTMSPFQAYQNGAAFTPETFSGITNWTVRTLLHGPTIGTLGSNGQAAYPRVTGFHSVGNIFEGSGTSTITIPDWTTVYCQEPVVLGTPIITRYTALEIDDIDIAGTNYSVHSKGSGVQMVHAGPIRVGSDNSPRGGSALDIDGGLTVKRTTFNNANYNVLPTDFIVAQVGTMSADRTVTLPAIATVEVGKVYIIKDESNTAGATNELIVDGNGAEAIDGSATRSLQGGRSSITIYNNGTGWFITSTTGTVV